MSEERRRYREVNDQVKESYIKRYEFKHEVSLMGITDKMYRELPYNTEVTLEQVISDVDGNLKKQKKWKNSTTKQ